MTTQETKCLSSICFFFFYGISQKILIRRHYNYIYLCTGWGKEEKIIAMPNTWQAQKTSKIRKWSRYNKDIETMRVRSKQPHPDKRFLVLAILEQIFQQSGEPSVNYYYSPHMLLSIVQKRQKEQSYKFSKINKTINKYSIRLM